jgi:DNA-directed RNA polymerase subunit RPC12/RpoP
MSVISFLCTQCFRQYRVAEAMGGKRVRCKDCGAEIQIPRAEAARVPANPPDDVFGLADTPPPPRRGVAVGDEPDDVPAPPRRAASATGRKKKTRTQFSLSNKEDPRAKLGSTGIGMTVVGFILWLMPRYGFVLSGRGGRNPWDPNVQSTIGALMGGAGVVMIVATVAWVAATSQGD